MSTTLGDVDNDGYDDIVYQAEQRLLIAVRIKSSTGFLLTTPEVIWVHFDPAGLLYKHTWGTDRPAIADFDGDGLNEVAAVLGPDASSPTGNLRLALIEHGAGPMHPTLGAPTPVFGSEIDLDTMVSGWTWHTYNHHQGFNFNVQASKVIGGGLPPEVFVHETEGGRIGLALYWRIPGTLWSWYARNTTGAATHFIHSEDVNGDGHDDLLNNGVIDVWNGCEFDFNTIPYLTNRTGNHNHADSVRPYDRDGDGVKELFVVHDGYDCLISNPGLNCQSSLIWENVRKNDATEAVFHGQQAIIGNLVNGADSFGFNGDHIVTAPKGPPLYFAGSVVLNGNAQELTIANNGASSSPVGPRGGLFSFMDWNGGPTKEVLSFSHNRYSVWKLVFDGTDPNLPYVWGEVFGHPAQSGPGTIGGFSATNKDIYGGSREDIVIFGRYGMQIVSPCP
ncbi:MAG: hypothetical protein AB8H80_03750 [Planctomycetota bacterium]